MTMENKPKNRLSNEHGFTLLELLVVVAVGLVVAGMAVPNFMSAVRSARLKGVVSDFSGLLQSARIKAVDDDRYYSVYVLGGAAPLGPLGVRDGARPLAASRRAARCSNPRR